MEGHLTHIPTFKKIQATYLSLSALNTLAASFIWGINTLFLLDAGLNNTEAFSANAFFTAGMLLFEIPTGMVADTWGRKLSYLLGASTLALTTALYLWLWYIHASFWPWAVVSIFLGLGFTFFSGAFEAWLVDALAASGLQEKMENVFSNAQIVEGVAMFSGSVFGGVLAQVTNLAVPYFLRILVFIITFVSACLLMQDIGFHPRSQRQILAGIKSIWKNSLRYGLGMPPVRWLMFETLFTSGVLIYAFYAMQPYLLELYGNPKAYSIAGLAAAIIAASQIVGGTLAPQIKKIFATRTTALFAAICFGGLSLAAIGFAPSFWSVIALLIFFGLLYSGITPIRQVYINLLIPAEQRATVLSFDSLMGSGGAIVLQPLLGKTADLWGYPASYIAGGMLQIFALPFIWLAKREKASSDTFNLNRNR
jgi:MFS family permease